MYGSLEPAASTGSVCIRYRGRLFLTLRDVGEAAHGRVVQQYVGDAPAPIGHLPLHAELAAVLPGVGPLCNGLAVVRVVRSPEAFHEHLRKHPYVLMDDDDDYASTNTV